MAQALVSHAQASIKQADIALFGLVERLSLMLANGTIVVRRPFSDVEVGMSLADGEFFRKHLNQSAAGTANIYSIIDGVERIVGFSSMSEYPLALYVARDKNEFLAKWRREATVTVVLLMLLIAVMVGLGYRLMKIMKHRVRAQNRLPRYCPARTWPAPWRSLTTSEAR